MKNLISIGEPGLKYLQDTLILRYEQHERTPETKIELFMDPSLSSDGFQIQRSASCVRVSARDLNSLFCGAGTVLHGDLRDTGFYSMQKPFRAVYFATHFDNWYCTASSEELLNYITDLALWGFNTLVFWQKHFQTVIDDFLLSLRPGSVILWRPMIRKYPQIFTEDKTDYLV